VGGNRTIKVNVRILATSNRDLLSNVEQGAFRQDLYYRLNVFPVHVPALRERPEDILPLAEHFLTRCARKMGVKVAGFSESALKAMLAYRWPGNVRELQNTIERAVILTENGRMISSSSLGLPSVVGVGSGETLLASAMQEFEPSVAAKQKFDASFDHPLGEGTSPAAADHNGAIFNIAELEKQAIKASLVQTAGNRTKAAELLGISIRTLRNKLQEYRDAGDPVEVGADLAD